MAPSIASVILSAYMTTLPLTLRAAPDRLDERSLAAEEALLVGVEDGDEGHPWQIEPLPEQVHPDEDVVLAEAKLANDLDALQRVDLRMQVARLDARFEQVVGQVLGHLLRQGGDQHALAGLLPPPGFR